MSYLYKIILTKSRLYFYELISPFTGHIVTLVVLKLCVAGRNFSVTYFYRLLLMNEISWTLILVTVILMQLSAKGFWLL